MATRIIDPANTLYPLDEKQVAAIKAWREWYSRKLDRIAVRVADSRRRGQGLREDYSPAEDDLFQAFGCIGVPEGK